MSKRVINLWLSLGLAASDWLWYLFSRLLGRAQAPMCIVLAYLSVGRQERVRFARQMDILVRYATPVPAAVRALPSPGGRYAAVTFDDGLQCIVENALPELKKRGIPATLFIVTEVLGGYAEWQYLGGDDPSTEKTMSVDQLRELPSELVTIGSHTMTHAVLPALGDEQLSREILGSRVKLEQILNQEVKLLSFPYGAFDERVIERCRQDGYERVFTALPVLAFADSEEFVTGRVGAAATDWPIEFRLKLAGAYRWLPQAYAWKRWLLSRFSRQGITRRRGLDAGENGVV